MPGDKILKNGQGTTYTFSLNDAILLQEKEVTPMGFDGGGSIDITTMRTQKRRMKEPKNIYDVTDSTATVAYAPNILPQILAMRQQNQLITVNFPDGSGWQDWGALDKFVPGSNKEGEQPTAELTIIWTGHDTDDNEVEPVQVNT